MLAKVAVLGLLVGGCARGTSRPPESSPPIAPAPERAPVRFPRDTAESTRLPGIPATGGALRISVVYPDSTIRVNVRDSSFIFGSVGDGRATLLVNGQPVPVAPNGAWLGWVPFRGDSLISFVIEARTPGDSARLVYRVRRAPRYVPPERDLWVDTTSLSPVGRVWWPREEYLPLAVRASEGARLELHLPGRKIIPFRSDSPLDPVPESVRAFDRDSGNLVLPSRGARYRAMMRGLVIESPATEPPSRRAAQRPSRPILLAIKGRDTLRASWPLRLTPLDTLPLAVELDPDPERTGRTDGLTKGRTVPGGTYTWFFPQGTRARVTGRINDDLRLALSRRSEAWVAAGEARPAGAPGEAIVGSITVTPGSDRVGVRVPVGARLPFQVVEEMNSLTLVLYGARSDVNWLRYGREDSLVSLVTTRQIAGDELELRFALEAPVFGYRVRWEGSDLVLEIRRPPRIATRRPLEGRIIVLDPGHPPLGATGPTGLTEAEANLLVAQQLEPLLVREGARVFLTRNDSRPVELAARVRFADSVNADLLIAIHNNALPDGINPFSNNGSSVFYNHPRALPLARAIQSRLVAHTGLRDLGVARGDLALTRATWMPAVLTEGLFMMLPEQEAALRSAEGRRLYAVAILEGIRRFLGELVR